MARLTSFSRLLIALALVAGVYFAVRTFLPNLTKSGSDNSTTTEQPQSATKAEETAPVTSTAPPSSNTFTSNFNFTAPLPVNGRLKGVVELGATGFNSFIIRIDAQKNWKLENSEFGASLVHENMATDEDVRQGLKRYIAKMLDFGVQGKDIHFVVSSGAAKAEVTEKIIRVLRTMNYFVNIVTPQQEAQYAYRAAIGSGFEGRAFVVDIGSGNTKIAYKQGAWITGIECPGAKYYQNGMNDAQVYQEVKGKANQVPASLRQTCFIIGGVPFELADQVRKDKKERYTPLMSPGAYQAKGEKQKAGLNIYKAIADATGCQQFVFDWDANFTIGFLLGL
ncbi:MAG: hypothetical protein JNL02_07510 [Saprospiraceae bacterium]|nr:hypothetical protein [Saprospiraceae bacterium]